MLTLQDEKQLSQKGIPQEKVNVQLAYFEKGFPFLKLDAAASIGKGLLKPDKSKHEEYLAYWKEYIQGEKSIIKFVPASGAASRMFKNLFEFLGSVNEVPLTDAEKEFFTNLSQFAFYDDLNDLCLRNEQAGIDDLLTQKKYKAIVSNLLGVEGLNYGTLPKGLLKFHKYEDGIRTPMEEHMVEGALYAKNKSGRVNIHFTVSTEHKELFRTLVREKEKEYSHKYDADYHITFSEQKPSTDTVAVDLDNKPFRENGELVFRPGGHGALIENLNDLDADILFIKNIDNVVPDRLKGDTVEYKQLIAGVLVTLQKQIFEYLELLDSGKYTPEQMIEMAHFVQHSLCCRNPRIKELGDAEFVLYLRKKLNRPIRVCGMVKNVGEPGGGPFFACNSDGTVSLQILESSQIDMNDPEKREMFEKGTHFNPVDLVCAVRNYKGQKFNLMEFVDHNTGFISRKSKNGRELKALELPGLWNGAMSNWNTVFVEVPLTTFNPVKTVNDLLRRQHQSS